MKITKTVQFGTMLAGSLIILVVLAAIFGLTLKQNDMIKNYIHISARAYFESIVLTRRWNAGHGGVFVLKREGMKSNPYLDNPDITTTDGAVYTKKNPALMTREISELAKRYGTYQYHITSLMTLNPTNAPDPWERKALESFERGVEEAAEISRQDDRKVYRFMKPLFYEKGCVACHAEQGYKLGDVRGGISVMLPYNEIETALKDNQQRMLGLGLSILLVMGFTFYLLVWQLMKRLSNTVDLLDNEKKKLEETQASLLDERNKLDDIVSSIDADLLLLDRDMKILWVNRKLRERKAYASDELIGRFCNKAYCNIDEIPADCPSKLALETGKAVHQEHPITHPDGTTRFYAFTCSPVKDSGGNIMHILELVQDITEKKNQEEAFEEHVRELARAQKALLEKNSELERFNQLFVDREFKIKELKDRVQALEQEKKQ